MEKQFAKSPLQAFPPFGLKKSLPIFYATKTAFAWDFLAK